VRPADASDLQEIKSLLDSHRGELGFMPLPALQRALERGWLYVAESDGHLVGVMDWWMRRDGILVLYAIAVSPSKRRHGIGRLLVSALVTLAQEHDMVAIQLKCPIDLPANEFYLREGFTLIGEEAGKRRRLNHWGIQLRTRHNRAGDGGE